MQITFYEMINWIKVNYANSSKDNGNLEYEVLSRNLDRIRVSVPLFLYAQTYPSGALQYCSLKEKLTITLVHLLINLAYNKSVNDTVSLKVRYKDQIPLADVRRRGTESTFNYKTYYKTISMCKKQPLKKQNQKAKS